MNTDLREPPHRAIDKSSFPPLLYGEGYRMIDSLVITPSLPSSSLLSQQILGSFCAKF
jgi:hypothetical protein